MAFPSGSGKSGTYTYAELEGLWIQAGGPRTLAPVAAAIAEAESGGNPNARNPSGATGLWQILGAVNPADQNKLTDPQVNAREAVLKWQTAPGGGKNFTPWTTFTSGAYKRFLNTKTTPATPGGTTGSTSSATPSTGPGGASSTCIIGISPNVSLGPISVGAGEICFFTKTEARALIGGLMLAAGGLAGFVGLAVLVAGGFSGTKAGAAAGRGLETVGAGVALIPGAEAAGAGIAAAGGGARKYSVHVQRKRQTRAVEDTQRERQLGQPRENQNLRVGRGAIRERPEETRRRRTQRSISPGGKPASRAEAGF
jgi:lysozyme-like protein